MQQCVVVIYDYFYIVAGPARRSGLLLHHLCRLLLRLLRVFLRTTALHDCISPAMSTPGEYYRSLPPVSKTYGVICVMTSSALHFNLYYYSNILLVYEDIIKRAQVWRVITNFFFLGPFSPYFALRLIMLARYGVMLEKGAFKERTADFLWMVIFGALSLLAINLIPPLNFPFLGPSLVFMMLYVWSREVPDSRISIFGVVTIKGMYLPWAMLMLDVIFNDPLRPDIMGILAGHMYHFLSVLHPLSGGKNILKTPIWVHKLAAYWGVGFQANSPVRPNQQAGVAFRGRSHRLGTGAASSRPPQSDQQATAAAPPAQPGRHGSEVFRGRSYRLNQ